MNRESSQRIGHIGRDKKCRKIPYQSGLNVHDYLDDGMLRLANSYPSNKKLDFEMEEDIFLQTFNFLNHTVGKDVFKRWYGDKKCFQGKFLVSAYQTIAVGVSKHLDAIAQIKNQSKWIHKKIEQLWKDNNYSKYLTGGTTGAMQLTKLLPENFFCP